MPHIAGHIEDTFSSDPAFDESMLYGDANPMLGAFGIDPATGSGSGFDFGGLISGLFGGIADNLGTIGSAAGGMAAIKSAYDRLGAVGDQALAGAGEIAGMGLTQSQFQPFTVRTGTGGNVAVDQFGGVDLSTGQGGLEQSLLGEASRRFTQAPIGTTTFANFGNQALGVGGGQLGMAPALSPELQAASFGRCYLVVKLT